MVPTGGCFSDIYFYKLTLLPAIHTKPAPQHPFASVVLDVKNANPNLSENVG